MSVHEFHGRQSLAGACLLASFIAHSFAALAADWRPEKNIEIVVGVTPGGPVDVSARLIQKLLQDKRMVNVAVSVLNKPGANNSLAWIYLNQHPGDGHYLAMTLPNIVANRIVGTHPLNYTDVTPLAQLNSEYIAFSVKSDSPLKSGRELLVRLERDPASLSIAFSNIGSANHIGVGVLVKPAGLDIRKLKLVAFKGASDAALALLGGHVDVLASSASTIMAHVQSGTVRMIAVAAPRRLGGALAAVPTWKEQGTDAVFANWRGVIGPKGMSSAQIAFWDATLAAIVQTEEWKKEVEKNDWEPDYMNSAESRRFLERQDQALRSVLAELGLAK